MQAERLTDGAEAAQSYAVTLLQASVGFHAVPAALQGTAGIAATAAAAITKAVAQTNTQGQNHKTACPFFATPTSQIALADSGRTACLFVYMSMLMNTEEQNMIIKFARRYSNMVNRDCAATAGPCNHGCPNSIVLWQQYQHAVSISKPFHSRQQPCGFPTTSS